MTTGHWTQQLRKVNACGEAVRWAQNYPSFLHAWTACKRGDWMLWWAGRTATTTARRKRLVLVACQCARLALKHVPKHKTRPRAALDAAEAWARGGEMTLAEVRAATYAAADAADATAYAVALAAANAAYAATYAAYAADATAANTAYATAYAVALAAADAADAANAAARNTTLAQCAELVRTAYPRPPRMLKETA